MRTPLVSLSQPLEPAAEILTEAPDSDNLRGAILMVGSMAAFTPNDAAMKYLTETLPLGEAIFLRGLCVTLIFAVIANLHGGLTLRGITRRDWGLMSWRAVGEVGSTLLYLAALQHMALGDLSAITQSLPLVVMLAAAVFFKERLGWRRLTAVAIGLLGVLIIVQPGTSAFTVWSLVALASVLAVVLREMTTRAMSPGLSATTISFISALSVGLSGLFVPGGDPWHWPTLEEWSVLAISICLVTVGYQLAVQAMRVGEVGFVSPFRYTSLLFAIILSGVIFGDWPDLWTWGGAGLVVMAGIYSILREAKLARRGR